jgi:hypothetical protein
MTIPFYWKINNVLIVLIMAHAGGRHLNHLVLQRKSKKSEPTGHVRII